MTSIEIVGTGIHGLNPSLALQPAGVDTTVYAGRSADALRRRRIPEAATPSAPAVARERALAAERRVARETSATHRVVRWVCAVLAVCAAFALWPAAASADPLGGLLAPVTSLLSPTGAQPVTPAPAPDPLAYNQALHLTPPLATRSGTTAIADTALVNQLTVDICKFADGGCAYVTRLTPRSSLLDKLYHATWQGTGAKAGDVYKFTFRAAQLNIGSAILKAGNLLQSTQVGNFTAGLPVSVDFWVDRVPVIRTRALHDVGASSVDVGQMLHNQFNLGDADALTAVYRDVRTQIDQLPQAGALRAASTLAPFSPGQVVDSVASPATFGVTPKRAAELLKSRTPLGNQSVVNALVASNVFQGVISPGGLLAIITDTLGVTDRIPGLNLLKNSQREDGSPAFDASGVLRAIVEITNGPTSAIAALQQLADVGFPADTSMLAIKSINDAERAAGRPGLLPLSQSDAIATLAAAGLQTSQFSGGDIANGLKAVYGGDTADYNPSIITSAKNLVDQNCGDYKAPLQVGSLPDLLRTKTDVVGPADVVRQLVNGACSFTIPQAAAALHYVYTSTIAKPVDEMTSIGESLIKGLPNTPASDLLLGLTKVAKDQQGGSDSPAGTFSCLSVTGVVNGALAAGLGAAALKPFELTSVLGQLDSGGLGGLIVDPYGTGAGGPLDTLGQCLVKNGIVPPMPLRQITVTFVKGAINGTSVGMTGQLLVARAGWEPDLDAAVPAASPLFKAVKNVQVPSIGKLPALGSILQGATTLPVLVAGGPRVGQSMYDGSTGVSYLTHTAWDFNHGGRAGLTADCPACSKPDSFVKRFGSDIGGLFPLSGVPAISILDGAGQRTNGVARFVVPAIPGKLNLESTLFVNNNLNCLSGTPDPALMAAAIATPAAIYRALPGGDSDIMADGNRQITLPVKPEFYSQQFGFVMDGSEKCGRITRNNAHFGTILGDDVGVPGMVGVIDVEPLAFPKLKIFFDGLVNSFATKIAMAPGASPRDGKDYSLTSSLGGVAVPESITGNFLSLLGGAGGPALTGGQLTGLLGG